MITGVPTVSARYAILKVLLAKTPHDITDDELASVASRTHGYVGADLSAVVREAGVRAIKRYLASSSSSSSSQSTLRTTERTTERGTERAEGDVIHPLPPALSAAASSATLNLMDMDTSAETESPSLPHASHPLPPALSAAASSATTSLTLTSSSSSAYSHTSNPPTPPPLPKLTYPDLLSPLTKITPSALRSTAPTSTPAPTTYSSIGGSTALIHTLRQSIEWPLKYPESFKRLGVKACRGVLMWGPPGCSKTLVGRAVACESGVNFIAVKGPEV